MNNVQNAAWVSSDPSFYQMQLMGTSNVPSREQTENEKKERMRKQLSKKKIPEDLWQYYLETPEHWDFEDTTKEGLQKGIEAILKSPNTVTPCWVEKESMNKFVNPKMKLTAVTQAVAEINRFIGEDMPDDNQLAAEHKQAQKRAEKLQTNLQIACNELTALTVIADEFFGDEFFSSISTFVEETRKNEKARDKVLDMKSRLPSRGIVTHQTNISSDQVKNQLPIFTGESTLSILDASDTWTNILSRDRTKGFSSSAGAELFKTHVRLTEAEAELLKLKFG